MNENSKSFLVQPDQQDEDSRKNLEQIENKTIPKAPINDDEHHYNNPGRLLLPPEQTTRERTLSIEPDNDKSQQAIHSHEGSPKAERASRASFGNIVLEADQKLNGENSHLRKALHPGRHGGANGLAFLKGLVSYWRKDLHELSHEELLEIATFILRKPLEKRTVKDMGLLMRGSVAIEFFQQFDQKTIEHCLKTMFYVFMRKDQTVFEIGSVGTTHWVILKGSVGVWAYDETQLDDEQEEMADNFGGKLSEIKVLTAGSSFGERALIDNKPRSITVRCKEECHFAVLDKKDYSYILMEKEARRIAEEIEFFASLPMLKDWSQKSVKNMLYFSKLVKYHRGQKIYKEGDDPEKFYIVRRGEFKILKHVEIKGDIDPVWQTPIDIIKKQSINKKSLELAILCEKEIFGEEELLHDKCRQYTVLCHSSEADVYEVDKKVFFEKILKSSIASKWISAYSENKIEYYKTKVLELSDSKLKNKGLLMFERKDFNHNRLSLHLAKDYVVKDITQLRDKSVPSKCISRPSAEKNKRVGTANPAETKRPQIDHRETPQYIERIFTADGKQGRRESLKSPESSRIFSTPGLSTQRNRDNNTPLYRVSSKLWRDEVTNKIEARRSASLFKQSREETPTSLERNASRKSSKKPSQFKEEAVKLNVHKVPTLVIPTQAPEGFEVLFTPSKKGKSPHKFPLNIDIPTLTDRTVGDIKLTSPNYNPNPIEIPSPIDVKPPTLPDSPLFSKKFAHRIRTSVRKVSCNLIGVRSPSNEPLLTIQDKDDIKSKNMVLFNNALNNHELQFLKTLNSEDRGYSQIFKNIHMIERKRKDTYQTQNAFERASLKLQNEKLEDILRLNSKVISNRNNQASAPDLFKPIGPASKFQGFQLTSFDGVRGLALRGSQSGRTSRSRPRDGSSTHRPKNTERLQTANITGFTWRKRVI